MFSHNPFEHLQRLPIFTPEMEEEMRRSLLSNQIFPRQERKPCAEIDMPLRGGHRSQSENGDSQITKLSFDVSIGVRLDSFEMSEEAIGSIREQLRQDAMERFMYVINRLCTPIGALSFEQRHLSTEAQQCVVSVANSLNVSMSEAFEMCDRFLSRQDMSWEVLSYFIDNGLIRQHNGELAIAIQVVEHPILRDREIAARMMIEVERGRGETQSQSCFIGDTTCKYNARSPHIRCAINPCGPCQECTHREENQP